MSMTWTQHGLPHGAESGTCRPWLLSVSGDVAHPQRQSRKKHKRRLAAVDSAISLFLYVAAPDGELFHRNATRASGGEPLVLLSGYRRKGIDGALPAAVDGFGMLAWASQAEHGANAGAEGPTSKRAPLLGRTHHESDGAQLAAPGAPLPSAARLQQAWHASGATLPSDDAWKLEDLLRSSLERSASQIAAAASAGRAAARQARKRDLEAAAAAAGGATPSSVPASAEERALQAALDVPVVPALGAAGSTPRHGSNVIAAQLLLAPPFRLQVLFLQQDCFAAAASSASEATAPAAAAAAAAEDDHALKAAATSPVRRIAAETWLRLGERLGLAGSDGGIATALATTRRRQYYEDLCSRLSICVSEELGSAHGFSTPAEGTSAVANASAAHAVSAPVVAARAVANLVGSITHFYGRQLVAPGPYPPDGDTSSSLRGARESELQHLFTGVPSRSFFPRGFLWDEGFHQLILSQVNAQLSVRVLASWLASMDEQGWIAREQILGGEARSRVPERFRVQHTDIANPPALLLPFLAIAADTLCKPHVLTATAGGSSSTAAVGVSVDGQVESTGAAATIDLPPFVSAGARAFCAARLPAPPSAGSSGEAEACRYACIESSDSGILPSVADVLAAPLLTPVPADVSQAGDGLDIARFLQEVPSEAIASAGDSSAARAVAAPAALPSAAAQQHTLAFMRAAYPLLVRHYAWLRRTQAGAAAGSFRWRGASVDHNFASGLDDYPRGAAPTLADENVDLLSWVAFFARALEQLSVLVEAPGTETAEWRADAAAAEARLLSVHWDEASGLFCDVAAQSLRSGKSPRVPPAPVMGRVCHEGYVSLAPLMLRLLPTRGEGASARIAALLSAIEDPKRMWTPRGLRSLSAASRLYRSKEDYWRGAIWLNMNYLTVGALRYYGGRVGGGVEDEVAARAAAAGERLASALVDGVVAEYQRSGFIWENYDPETGHGRGTHPFTGWSALVALLLARRFPV